MQSLPQLWRAAIAATNETLFDVGLLGRYESDGSVTTRVPNSSHRAYVRVGAAEITGEGEALNMGAPWVDNIPVRLLKLGRVWIIVGVDYNRRELAAHEFNVAPHEHLPRAGLGGAVSVGAPQDVTIRVGQISVPTGTSNVRLLPESGTVDNLDFIAGGDEGQLLLLATTQDGDSITLRSYINAAVGNIDMRGSGNNRTLLDPHDSVLLVYRTATEHWEEVGPMWLNQLVGVVIESPADGDVLAYDDGGGNWVNAAPPSSWGAVTSVNGQTGAVDLDADGIDETATRIWFSSAEETKLAGIATGANLYVHPNHTGDVTSSGDGATTIANDAVTNAKAADMAEARIKGRAAAAGTGDPTDLTAAQVRTIINVEDGADVTDAANIATSISGASTDDTIADADLFGYITGGSLVKTAWSNIKAVLKTYFDTLYNLYVHPNHSGDVTSVGDGATTIANNAVTTAKILDDAVTFDKIGHIFEERIVGRAVGAGTGALTPLTASEVRTLINVADGANNYSHPNHSGDVTSVGDGATTIANNAVTTAKVVDGAITNAKRANMAEATISGRAAAAGTGDPTDLTASQVVTIIQSVLNTLYGQLAAANTWAQNQLFSGDATVMGNLNVNLVQRYVPLTATLLAGETWTIDITMPNGNRRTTIFEINVTSGTNSANIYTVLSGKVEARAHPTAGNVATILSYDVNAQVGSSMTVTGPTAITDGVRFTIASPVSNTTGSYNRGSIMFYGNLADFAVSSSVA